MHELMQKSSISIRRCLPTYDFHIHVPGGGTPKDGPSAGVTLLSSILSALTGRAINAEYAMTGELNLRGNVMPIGGVKEKILAAKRNLDAPRDFTTKK